METAISAPSVLIEITLPGKPASFFGPVTSRCIAGRAPECDLRIDTDSVSRRHAELSRDPFGRWWLKDLKSRNGTKVNGVRIEERTVGLADVIRMGEATLRLRAAGTEPLAGRRADLPGESLGDMEAITEEDAAPSNIVPGILAALLDLADGLASEADAAQRRRVLCSLLTSGQFPGIAALLMTVPREGDEIRISEGPCMNAARSHERYHVSRTLLRKAVVAGRSVMGANSGRSSAVVQMSIDASTLSSAGIACPLEENADVVTCLYLAIDPRNATGEWLSAVSLAARHYREAHENWIAREEQARHAVVDHDLQQAHEIQQRLVAPPGRAGDLEWEIYYEPSRWVGGDYAEAVTLHDGSVLLAVADVCGKGMQAALVSSSLHTLLRTGVRGNMDLAAVVTLANEHMREYLPLGSFITLVAVRMQPATGSVEFCNAGHPLIAIVSADGGVREITNADGNDGFNLPLAIGAEAMTTGRFELRPGEIMALYTDGLTDLEDEQGNQLGRERLLQILGNTVAAARGASLTETMVAFRRAMEQYRGAQLPPDDQTLLLCRRHG